MAWEAPGQIVNFPCITTGLARYRFVAISTAGNVQYPSLGAPCVGVLQIGTTHTTRDPVVAPVMISGVSKVSVASQSTVGVGQVVAASSRGSIVPSTVGSYVVGQVIAGTSGAANRVISVLLANGPSNSTALFST